MQSKKTINPYLAAVLSLCVPGLGQIVSGAWQRGLVMLVGIPAQAGLLYGAGVGGMIPLLGIAWAWNVWDAWQEAHGIRVSASFPALVIFVINIITSWTVTEITVPKLDQPQRNVIGHIVYGLTHPDLMEPKRSIAEVETKYIVIQPGEVSERPVMAVKPGASISVDPQIITYRGKLTVTGKGFAPGASGKLFVLGAEETPVAEIKVDENGEFRADFANPRRISGEYFLQARVSRATGGFQFSETLKDAAPLMFQTVYLALLGTAVSLVFALPLSFLGARNLMSSNGILRLIYYLTRGLFTLLRSVEVLIIAVVAVAAVGVGPFAGVIALAVHGIGALGKLYSESIESIESGPIEAIRSTGANEPQVVVYAVIPQVVPQFISFTLYRWDINVRMATVIGLVGGGGIGARLVSYMQLLQWEQAATAIWLIAGVVMLMDWASAVIREKLV